MPGVYSPTQKRVLPLTEKIGEGGEGIVFAYPSDPLRVCKVYHASVLQTRGDTLARKLAAMLADPPHASMLTGGVSTFAWPEELLFDPADHHRPIGFVMPRIRRSSPLHTLYSPEDRKQLTFPPDKNGVPLPDYYIMAATARNLAEAFRGLHSQGHVMADVNEDNIRFRADATVSLIDTDSFQIRDQKSGEIFLAPMMKAEYWPADSLERNARKEALTTSHDDFGMAIFLFRLLMNGVHPFHGMSSAGIDPPSPVENITAGRFPFLPAYSQGLRPPFHAPAYDALPAELRELFRRCFVEGTHTPSARPGAEIWTKALEHAQATLQGCGQGHLYFAEAHRCPWCIQEEAQISCPKGHRFYRDEGFCPQCRLEQRRAVLQSQKPHRIKALPAATVRFPAPPSPTNAPLPIPPLAPTLKKTTAPLFQWEAAVGLLTLILLFFFCVVLPMTPDQHDAEARQYPPTHLNPVQRGGKHFNAKDGAEVIWIPAGSFQMGSPDQPSNPPHTITLAGYWIYKDDVTINQYRKYIDAMQAQGKTIIMPLAFDDQNTKQGDYPIVDVTWQEAMDYCQWAGVSLPTEEQWEKAATWDEAKKVKVLVPWGDDGKRIQRLYGRGNNEATVVGAFGFSPSGCTDMAGNVEQWCRDREEADSSERVVRGADASTSDPDLIRADRRGSYAPDSRSSSIGFRGASGP